MPQPSLHQPSTHRLRASLVTSQEAMALALGHPPQRSPHHHYRSCHQLDAQAIADSGTASGSCPPGTNGRKVATMTPLTIAHASSPLIIVPPVAGKPRAPTLLPPSPRLTSKRQSRDTAGSALTGRHPPAAREHSHLFGLSRVRSCTFFQPGFSGVQAIHERRSQ